jgi:hypothetical protein
MQNYFLVVYVTAPLLDTQHPIKSVCSGPLVGGDPATYILIMVQISRHGCRVSGTRHQNGSFFVGENVAFCSNSGNL